MVASLAFCNDVDFADWASYQEVHRVLREEFDFPSEDSFWLFDPAGSDMALFRSSVDEKGPRHGELLAHIRSGRLAVLHSAGNFSRSHTATRPTRALVGEGLAYLREYARVPAIWTNHGDEGDIQNIGGGAPSYQKGDDPSSSTYVLDLLLQAGVEFFSLDHHPSNTFAFATHSRSEQSLLVKERTRAGYDITCFFRYRGPLPKAPDAQTLARQLSRENLESLIDGERKTVIYQHWCVHRDSEGRPHTASSPVFNSENMDALRRLAKYHDDGLVRVLPVSQLLAECRNIVQGQFNAN